MPIRIWIALLLLSLPAIAIAGHADAASGAPTASTSDPDGGSIDAPAIPTDDPAAADDPPKHDSHMVPDRPDTTPALPAEETSGSGDQPAPPDAPPALTMPPPRPPTLDGLHLILTLDSTVPLFTAHRGGWRYPSGGIVHYSRTLHVDARTHVPFGIPDVIGGLIQYAATGDSNRMPPLIELLNPNLDAAANVNLMSLAMDGVLRRSEGQRVYLGGEWALAITSRRVQADMTVAEEIDPPGNFDEEKVATTLLNQLAFRTGVAQDFGGTRLLFVTFAGNGFGGWSLWNPLVGAELSLHTPARGWAGVHARVRYQAQSIDYSGYETNFLEQPFYEIDLREWNRVFLVNLGFTFRLASE